MMRSIFIKVGSILFLGGLFFSSLFAYTAYAVPITQEPEQCWQGRSGAIYNCDVAISPTVPSDQAELTVTFQGEFSNSCHPTFRTTQLSGGTIRVHLIPQDVTDLVCLTVITPFDLPVPIGYLNVGIYQLEIVIEETVVESRTFTVQSARTDLYLPLILNP